MASVIAKKRIEGVDPTNVGEMPTVRALPAAEADGESLEAEKDKEEVKDVEEKDKAEVEVEEESEEEEEDDDDDDDDQVHRISSSAKASRMKAREEAALDEYDYM